MSELLVYLHHDLLGRLSDEGGEISFRYDDAWLTNPRRHPLSHSLPLQVDPFPERKALPFFAGLLPDGQEARNQLGRVFDISSDNDFGLLAALGRDCAGAVVICKEPMPPFTVPDRSNLEPLSEERLAELIRNLPQRPLFVDGEDITLSLAGAHDKAAVYLDSTGQIHLPHRGFPSSHILKVDIRALKDSVRTEHFCLTAAERLGLNTAKTQIGKAEDQIYMLVWRYDRVMVVNGNERYLKRVHQEDFCQALGVLPRYKYEHEGGPSIKQMVGVLREISTSPARDIAGLMRSVIFNFLIGNPDGHAKNSSMLRRVGVGGFEVSLAPIYDVNNARAFRDHYAKQRARLAQSIAGERDPTNLTADHWETLAKDVGLGWTALRNMLNDMAGKLPDVVRDLRQEVYGKLEDTHLLDLVVDDVVERCDKVQEWFRPVVSARMTM